MRRIEQQRIDPRQHRLSIAWTAPSHRMSKAVALLVARSNVEASRRRRAKDQTKPCISHVIRFEIDEIVCAVVGSADIQSSGDLAKVAVIGQADESWYIAEPARQGEWDWSNTERECRRAIQLNPNYPTAHTMYARYLGAMSRFEEAIGEAMQAQQLDPLSRRHKTADQTVW